LRPSAPRRGARRAAGTSRIGAGGAVLIAMGVLIWTGELFQLNIQAQRLLDSVGINFFNSV
jgi:cytochrome c-type biogenesis protein